MDCACWAESARVCERASSAREIARGFVRWFEIVRDGSRWFEMVRDGSRWFEMARGAREAAQAEDVREREAKLLGNCAGKLRSIVADHRQIVGRVIRERVAHSTGGSNEELEVADRAMMRLLGELTVDADLPCVGRVEA